MNTRHYRTHDTLHPAHDTLAPEIAGPQRDESESSGGGAADLIRATIGMRRLERDFAQIASDPAALRGFSELPASIQALATTEPTSFWMLWQLGQSGVDLHEIDQMRRAMQECVDSGLRAAGWDGSNPPSDEQLHQAELAALRLLEELPFAGMTTES
ncbi:MAG TPA: hypothetical protein VKB34_12010 [Povalibacter sp.]|nr:hypothetical protein [Povalibacter sp.]